MGRSISDRLSYRNHYMCSGKATSYLYISIWCLIIGDRDWLVDCETGDKIKLSSIEATTRNLVLNTPCTHECFVISVKFLNRHSYTKTK